MVGIAPKGIPVIVKAIAEEELVSATYLTHLSIIGCIVIHKNVMLAISKAVNEGKLPRLQSLRFTGAAVTFELKDLFGRKAAPLNLTHYLASNNGLLSKLTSLAISLRVGGKTCFDCSWSNFASLSMKDMTKSGFSQLSKAISQGRLINLMKLSLSVKQNEICDLKEIVPDNIPLLKNLSVQRCIGSKDGLEHLSCLLSGWSLQTLDISHSRGIKGDLSVLMSQHYFTLLENLILHDCDLNRQDLISLDRANKEGKLLKLDNLDVSGNCDLIESFGVISSRWIRLKRLRIDYLPLKLFPMVINGFNVLCPLLDKDCFPSIQELRIMGTDSFPERTGRWGLLKRLDIVDQESTGQILTSMVGWLVHSVHMGDLPSLQTVCLLTKRKIGEILPIDNIISSKLRQKGIDICVVDPDLEKIMVNAGLV